MAERKPPAKKRNKKVPYNSRAIAARAIFAILASGKSLQEVLPESLDKLKETDKPWLHEMLYGVLRNLPTLQYWLRQHLTSTIKNESRIIEHLLYLGLYQLRFSRVAEHAAVSETVAACESLHQKHLKGLVNGVLRNFQRAAPDALEIEDERIGLNLPKWFHKKLLAHYPEEYRAIALQQSSKPPIWLRINPIKGSVDNFISTLEKAGIALQQDNSLSHAVRLLQSKRIEDIPGYQDGGFSVQDKAAQHAAVYLDPQENDIILDACAAPGGKYCHIFEVQPAVKRCIALEIDQSRLDSVSTNAQRLGIENIELRCGDAANTSSWDQEQLMFNRILLDAPCSATGIIRRHPDILWLRKKQDIDNLVDLQARIIDELWQRLLPGGILLYATCSILPEENRQQIIRFLNRTHDAVHIPLTEQDTPENPGRQILPGESGMDGFYYAKLQKQKMDKNDII